MEQITKLSKENSTFLSNTIIEEQLEIQIKKILKKYLLKTIVFLESNIHWSMAYNKPSFKKVQYNQWSFYNDKTGYFQEYDNINFLITNLLKLNRIPLFLIYVSVLEIEVPEIIQIKSNQIKY